MSSGIENSVKKRNSRCRTNTKRKSAALRRAFLRNLLLYRKFPAETAVKKRSLKTVILKSDEYRAHNGNIRGVHAKRQYPLPAAYLLGYERRNENYRRNTQAHRQIEVNILLDKRHGFTADKRTERENNA